MNSNKLKRLRKIWWVTGEGYPLKTRDMEWGWLDVSWSFCKECFGMGIDLFLLLVPWLGFWLLVEAKGCFWAGEGCLDITAFPSFIVVGGVPWSSWFWPGHFFNFWIMGFLIGVKLTIFSDKILPQTKLVKEIGFMVKALSARVFIRVFEVCWSLVLIPPNGCDTLGPQTSISFWEITLLPPNQIPLSLLMKSYWQSP